MARCTVERRMRALGLTGAGPGRTVRTTGPAKGNPVPDDLLRRDFTAARPNRRWVVDFTYVPTWSGFCCTAFVTGPVLPPDRRLGHQQPHGAPTSCSAPWSRRSSPRALNC